MRYLTAGESHGPKLISIIEGVPSNLSLSAEDINADLARRQKGYGRGGRMRIEKDQAEILSGVRLGKTLGSPIALSIENRDWVNWQIPMAAHEVELTKENIDKIEEKEITNLRPGHADFAGAVKYRHKDIRNVLERSSARETAARVAVGAIARRLLKEFDIAVYSHVVRLGTVVTASELDSVETDGYKAYFDKVESSEVRCGNQSASQKMIEEIEKYRKEGNTLGGIFEVVVTGLPVGLGSYSHWDARLSGKLAQAIASINGVKGMEIGAGFEVAAKPGSQVHDEIYYDHSIGFYRETNRAGGLEGGMTNGEPLVLRGAMKPIPTMITPLQSVDFMTKEAFPAHFERSDVTAVPAAGVVAEAMTAIILAQAMQGKFGGDALEEMKSNYNCYVDYVKTL